MSDRRNPLFIGNAFATNPPLRLQQSFAAGRNPLFIGNAFATSWIVGRISPVQGRNPLFIGNAFATGYYGESDGQIGRMSSQSPIHRECFCYRYPPLRSYPQTTVAIPYSSGMLLLLVHRRPSNGKGNKVAIPYSSGMLLLLGRPLPRVSRQRHSRNPLFIGNAFATNSSATWRYMPSGRRSQSPIHRECFCYITKRNLHRVRRGGSRNPLFIGNAFATMARRPRR